MNLEKVIAERPHKTVYRDGDRCIKVFDETYSKADVLNEALNQARVEQTGLAIPRILEVTMTEGKWAIVSDFIEGKTLSALMEEDPARENEYLEKLIRVQMDVLSRRCPLLSKLKDKMNTKINMAKIDANTRYDLHTMLEGMRVHNKVCHGDFNPSNVIIAGDGTPYVIDWAHATQGNAAADAARTYLLFCLEGKNETAEKYLDMFCELNGTDKKYVQKWMPIVAASQSVKEKEKERDFLLSWVNVVDYE